MAMLPVTIDPNEVEPAGEIGAIPEGKYLAEIIGSEMKRTKRGDGHYLALTYRVLDGEFAGRLVWHNLNLVNPNPTAQQIAQQQLSSICHACGYMQPVSDSDQLHNMPHVIKVAFVPPRESYAASNRIAAWERPAHVPTRPAAPTQQAAPATPGKPPWAAK